MKTINKPGPTAATVVTRPSLTTHTMSIIGQPHGKSEKKLCSGVQRRALAALLESPQGIRSFELQRAAYTMYPSRVISKLRAFGLIIETQLEPYVNHDGLKIRIGRYVLAPKSRHQALGLLRKMCANTPNTSFVRLIRTITSSMTAKY